MTFSTPIEIPTDRLLLRQFRSEDWEDMFHYYSDPVATQFTTKRVLNESECWQKIATSIGHWQIHGYGPYAIESKATHRVMGITGPWYPIDWPSPEIKWALAKDCWGNGFATEAVKAVQKMTRTYLPEIHFISFIDGRNEPSIKLARRVGAEFEAERAFRNGKWHVYRHPKTDPTKHQP